MIKSPFINRPDADSGGGSGSFAYIYIPAAAMAPAQTDGAEAGTTETTTYKKNRDYLAFAGGATEEEADVAYKMPNDYGGGTIKALFPWTGAAGSSVGDTVEFGIKAGATLDDGVIDSAFGTPQVISDTLLDDDGDDHQETEFTPAITIAGSPGPGVFVDFKVYRNTDGTDDMAEKAQLFGFWIQYTKA